MTTTINPPPAAPVRYRTAAEWLHELGDVPLERILFTPWPGTATEADLLRKVEVEKHLCELINGTLVEKPVGLYESQLAAVLIQLMLNFIRPRRLGAVSGEAGPLRLGAGSVRLPDVAFISRDRFRGKLPLEPIPSIAPDLAIEVLSESNTRKEIQTKISEYFGSGTRLVWIIDPKTRSAVVHTSANESRPIPPDGTLDGAEVLPGFQVPLGELFRAVDETLEDLGLK